MDVISKTTSLELFRRQYFQLLNFESLSWPEPLTIKSYNAQKWLHRNLFSHDHCERLPPKRYRARVLKQLLSLIESAQDNPEEDEISDDLMSLMTSMLGSKLPAEAVSAQQKVYVTYFFSEENEDRSQEGECSITLLESPSIISSSGTTGLRTWEAALFLGKYLKSNSDSSLIGDKTVLELGSGTGLVSILCARELQARRVVCTDGDEGVVDAIKVNVFLNGLEHSNKIEAAVLRWGHFLRIEEFEEDFAVKGLDVVLGADVTYETSAIPSLVATLRNLINLYPPITVLIAATVRNEATTESFRTACEVVLIMKHYSQKSTSS